MLISKTAVVTGAASGIGKALTADFISAGYKVYGVDINGEALSELTKASAPGAFVGVIADVTNEEDLRGVAQRVVKEAGAITIWVNNAGISGIGDFSRRPLTEWMRVLNINLVGLVYGSKIALEAMEEKGDGVIINMASVAGHVAAPFMTAYSASKHGVVGFTRALQAELRLKHSPVRVIMVSPGFVNTPIIAKGEISGFPEWLSSMLSTPEKVAKQVMKAIRRDEAEVYPTLNGKMMIKAFRHFPKVTMKSSKLLLTKSLKDALLNRYTVPD